MKRLNACFIVNCLFLSILQSTRGVENPTCPLGSLRDMRVGGNWERPSRGIFRWRIAVAEVSELVGNHLPPASTSVGQWMTLVSWFWLLSAEFCWHARALFIHTSQMKLATVRLLVTVTGLIVHVAGWKLRPVGAWWILNMLANPSEYVVSRCKTKRKIQKC